MTNDTDPALANNLAQDQPEAKQDDAAAPVIDMATERAALADLFAHFKAPDEGDTETVVEMIDLDEFENPATAPADATDTPKEE